MYGDGNMIKESGIYRGVDKEIETKIKRNKVAQKEMDRDGHRQIDRNDTAQTNTPNRHGERKQYFDIIQKENFFHPQRIPRDAI